jgi:predicted O-methyltransferase YrrM
MEISQYISEHSEAEDPILQELNRETHLKILMPRMLSGHIQGKLLEHFSKMIRPKNILELGTYTGYSAVCLAKGLADDGILDTVEINDELESFIRRYFAKAGIAEKVNLHIGCAEEIVPQLDRMYDLVFIDADKRRYPEYYHLVFDKVKPGGYILADNVLWDGKVAKTPLPDDDYTRGINSFNKTVQNDSRVENLLLPVRDGLMIIRKK